MLRSHSSNSVLVTGKLNVVGEFHNESRARRAEEKQFVLEKIGSGNYWTESQFPDLQAQMGIRDKQEQGQEDGADLMEYRAVHGAALLIEHSVPLEDAARRLGALKVGELTPEKTVVFDKLVVTFDQKVENYRLFVERAGKSVAPTATPEVNKVVDAVFKVVRHACQTYGSASRRTPSELSAAALVVADTLGKLPRFSPLLEQVVGVVPSTGGKTKPLEEEMRTQRSKSMGLAAVFSQEVGVWKVGNGHLEDLVNGRVKVDMTKVNFVTRDAFNQEFDLWRSSRVTK